MNRIVNNLTKKLSKNDLLNEYFNTVSNDMKNLEDLIAKKECRRMLINESISFSDQTCIKIRFCSAVIEYENCGNIKEKLSKGRKIVSFFIHQGSMFELKTLSKNRVSQLLEGNLDFLTFAKYDILSELCKNSDLNKLIANIQQRETSSNKQLVPLKPHHSPILKNRKL